MKVNKETEEKRKRIVKEYTDTQKPYTEEELKKEGAKFLVNERQGTDELCQKCLEIYGY